MAYAEAVLRGDECAGPHVRAACARHKKDLAHGHERGLYFDLKAAHHALGFIEKELLLSKDKWEGQPFKLHCSQQFIVGSAFGWKRADGARRYRRLYIEMGKANGKSPLAGALGLYGMAADRQPGAEIYSAGANKEQAKVLFNDAVKMARQSPALSKRITFSGGEGKEYNMAMLGAPQNGSFFRPISRESRRKGSGTRPHMAFCDEVHEHPDRFTIETLERGMTKGLRQPLLVMITNSGSDLNSVCRENHDHAVKVAHGEVEDDRTFSYVCALDEKDDPLTNRACWKKANPLLGIIVTEDELAEAVKQGTQIPATLNAILRWHFCVWTEAATAWLSRKAWEECEDEHLRLEDFAATKDRPGRRCFAGLDLSATKDLTAKALVFEDGRTDDGKPKFAAFCRAYTPAATLQARALEDNAKYDQWVKAGWLTATPGKVIRYEYVAKDLIDDKHKFDLVEVAYDAFLIKFFENAVTDLGGELPLREHGQGPGQRRGCEPDCDIAHEHKPRPLWMPQSIKDFEQLILEKRIRIEVNFALRTAVMSATCRSTENGDRIFTKIKSTNRIDMCVALAMAVGSAVQASRIEPNTGYVSGSLLVIH